MNSNVPGWTINIDEISLTDLDGRKVTDATIDLAKDHAFEIEKKEKRPWNRFLLDFVKLNLADQPLSIRDDLGFGSWIVEIKEKRIVYDGKDFWLIYETKEGDKWTDKTIIKYDDIKYTNLIELVAKLKS